MEPWKLPYGKLSNASLASILLAPVVECIHVLVGCVLRIKCPVADFAIELWTPVVECVHVLIGSLLTTKFTMAS